MMKWNSITASLPALIILSGLLSSPAVFAANKITICHITSGKQGKQIPITISEASLDTHKYHHGDYLGKCKTPSPVAGGGGVAVLAPMAGFKGINFNVCDNRSDERGRQISATRVGQVGTTEQTCD